MATFFWRVMCSKVTLAVGGPKANEVLKEIGARLIINRPGVAGAVLQIPP